MATTWTLSFEKIEQANQLMVAAMLAGPKQYGILKRSGSKKNGEESHNPVFKAHT